MTGYNLIRHGDIKFLIDNEIALTKQVMPKKVMTKKVQK